MSVRQQTQKQNQHPDFNLSETQNLKHKTQNEYQRILVLLPDDFKLKVRLFMNTRNKLLCNRFVLVINKLTFKRN